MRLSWLAAVLCCASFLAAVAIAAPAHAKHHNQTVPQTGDPDNPDATTGMNPLQGGANSTTLQGGTNSTTLQGGTNSTTLQGGTNSTTLQGGAAGTLIQGNVEDQTGPTNILFLLDCSYSMKEKISGIPKMECAKQVLQDAMRRIPPDINVGLRVFGQQSLMGFMEADCRATALLVPMGTGNRGTIISEVRNIKPYGLTPLTYALMNAAEDDFRGVQGRKIIILISDGMDTCNQNPCAVISQLPNYGIHIKIDVVGVDLAKDKNARRELDCIARTSGGQYHDANTAAQLVDSVSASVDKAISGRIIVKPGTNVKGSDTPPELMPQHATPDAPLPRQ
jgi:hypothetical protein